MGFLFLQIKSVYFEKRFHVHKRDSISSRPFHPMLRPNGNSINCLMEIKLMHLIIITLEGEVRGLGH
jgi:hypothetical protein